MTVLSASSVLVLALMIGVGSGQISDYLNDYPYYPPESADTAEIVQPKPEIIRHKRGSNITLKCTPNSCRYNRHKVYWEFKACKPDKSVSCEKQPGAFKNLLWRSNSLRQCIMKIQDANEKDSGIYRCIENNQVARSYEVEIIDFKNYGGPPKILDVSPSTLIVPQNGYIIIKCEVYSEWQPIIIWLKESDETNDTLEYSMKHYKKVYTPKQVYEMPNKIDVYLSKLNLQNITTVDSGLYVCAAISETGKDFKTVAVKVESYVKEPPSFNFSFLFLIPLSLILVPVVFWLCYYRKKIRLKRKPPVIQHTSLIRPILEINKSQV